MRVLVLGGAGMLAADLLRTAPRDSDIVALDRAACDVRDHAAVERALEKVAPDLVINASAYTAVDRAQSDREAAEAVNGLAVGSIGVLAAALHVPVVHFSTDYVFSGKAGRPYGEDDPPDPINVYGASKLLGERLLTESGARALIVRTQWLFGARGKSFARTMWDRAQSRLNTRVVDDQWGRPTYTVDLAMATWALVAREASGVVHATNSGEPTTWFGFARAIFESAGVAELVSPCSSADYITAAPRPAYSVLATGRLVGIIGDELPPWTSGLGRFLTEV